jgi:hypothetical protein
MATMEPNRKLLKLAPAGDKPGQHARQADHPADMIMAMDIS